MFKNLHRQSESYAPHRTHSTILHYSHTYVIEFDSVKNNKQIMHYSGIKYIKKTNAHLWLVNRIVFITSIAAQLDKLVM